MSNPHTKAATEAVLEAIRRWHPERDVVAVNVVYTYVEHAADDPKHARCELDRSHFGGVVLVNDEDPGSHIGAMATLAAATEDSADKLKEKTGQAILRREAAAASPDSPASDANDLPPPIADLLQAILSSGRRG